MRIVLDPWGGDYGSQISTPHEADTDESMVQTLDEEGEQCPWKPINPSPTTLPLETVVVDGVMRSDAFGMVEDGERRALALFGSFAAGAVSINSQVRIAQERVVRLFLTGGNWPATENVNVPVGRGGNLCYLGFSSKDETYEDLREALVNEMRRAEAQVAEALTSAESLVLADGSLKFFGGASSVVGVIKTIHKLYLPPKRTSLLGRLTPGQRTPFFCIESKRKNTGYRMLTCYLRLAEAQPIELSFAGLVRLEVNPSQREHCNVSEVFDQAAVKVRALASRAPKDPRAPQNLIPIGGLERRLRHQLGDMQLVVRGIKQKLRALQQDSGPLIVVRSLEE
jgi:uncharacterized protein